MSKRVERFEDLIAWQKARFWTRDVYLAALSRQLRSAVLSVPSNIAEGFERDGRREFVQFLAVAKGSVGEARSQPYLARDWGLLGEAEFETLHRLADETSRTISGLISYLQSSSVKGRKFDRNF